jgi:hypothetical protein
VPSIRPDSFKVLFGIIDAVPHSAITWPVVGPSSTDAEIAWNVDSDCSMIYWGISSGYPLFPYSASLAQMILNGVDISVLGRLKAHLPDRPNVLQIANTGPNYTKMGPGTQFKAAQDTLRNPGLLPDQVSALPWYAIARGMCGVRSYSFDTTGDKEARATKTIPSGELWTGCDPWGVGVQRWNALSVAFNRIKDLKPFILQPAVNAPDYGTGIVVGAKEGPAGYLLTMVNILECEQTIKLPSDRFIHDATRCETFRQLGEASSTMTAVAGHDLLLRLKPHESVAVKIDHADLPVDGCDAIRAELESTKVLLAEAEAQLVEANAQLAKQYEAFLEFGKVMEPI